MKKLIDHPSWFEHVKLFIGAEGTFDHHHGPMFIDECLANFREPGEAIGLHSGGFPPITRNQFRYHGGRFMCGQVNVLMALTDIGPGDGGTMLIPGSHKANFRHPDYDKQRMGEEQVCGWGTVGAIEVFMKAGDALVFVDGTFTRFSEADECGDAARCGVSLRAFVGKFPARIPAVTRVAGTPHAPTPPDRSTAGSASARAAGQPPTSKASGLVSAARFPRWLSHH